MQQNRSLNHSTKRHNPANNAATENQKYGMESSHITSQNDSFMDEVDSQAEPTFETKNYLFELQSKCNNLEYEKAKITMTHQNMLSELRHKNIHLEQLAGNLSQQNELLAEERDNLKQVLGEVREQNHELSKEINLLRVQMQNLQQLNLEQSFVEEGADYLDIIQVTNDLALKKQQIQSKDQEISRLQQQLRKNQLNQAHHAQSPLELSLTSKQTISQLEKQKNELSQRLEQANSKLKLVAMANQTDDPRPILKQKEQLQKQLKIKQASLLQLQQQKRRLISQVQNLKQDMEAMDRKNNVGSNEQIKRYRQIMKQKQERVFASEKERIQLQTKVNELGVDINRLKCQKNGLEQYNKYLETGNNENEEKRRLLQQQLYKSEKQISELKAQIFNEKMEGRKLLNNLKLEFEEQKIKNIEEIQEKSKEIHRMKELSLLGRHDKKDGEIEKAEQQIAALTSDNQALKDNLKSLQDKHEKVSLRYNSLQKQMRAEHQKHQKQKESFQNQIERLKRQNGSVQKSVGLERMILPPSSRGSQDEEHLKEMIQLLRIEKRQLAEMIKLLTNKQQNSLGQGQIIRKLDDELRQTKNYLFKNTMNHEEAREKIKIISELENQIVRINDQLRRERLNSQQRQIEISAKSQRYSTEIKRVEEQSSKLKRQSFDLITKNSNLQNELIKKDSLISFKEDEIKKHIKKIDQQKSQKQALKMKAVFLSERITELQKEMEQTKKDKDSAIEEFKGQLKKLLALKLQVEERDRSKLKQKNESKNEQTQEMKERMREIEKQNYSLKYSYSQSLQEINTLLVKCRSFQQKCKKSNIQNDRMKQQSNDIEVANIRADRLERQNEELHVLIRNYEAQLSKQNQLMVGKDMYFSQHHHQQQQNNMSLHPKIFSRFNQMKIQKIEKNEKTQYPRSRPGTGPKKPEFVVDSMNRNSYSYKI